jgi:hypothetical protein
VPRRSAAATADAGDAAAAPARSAATATDTGYAAASAAGASATGRAARNASASAAGTATAGGSAGNAAAPAARSATASRTTAGCHRWSRSRRHARRRGRRRGCCRRGGTALTPTATADSQHKQGRTEKHGHRRTERLHLQIPTVVSCTRRYPRRAGRKRADDARDQLRRDSCAWMSGAIFSAMYACPASLGCTPSGPIRSGRPTNQPSLIGSMNVAPASWA